MNLKDETFKFARLPVDIFLLLMVMFVLSGCSNEQDLFIQGKWARGDVHYWMEWNFDRGIYTYYFDYTNNVRNTYESGRYSILESGEDYLLLELYNQQGGQPSIEDRVELRIDIHRDEDTISIRRQLFNRVSESSLKALSTARAP
jgi:hypothetical protein